MDVEINYDQVARLSNEFGNSIEEFKQCINLLSNIVSKVDDAWDGEDALAFIDMMRNENISKLWEFYGYLNVYQQYLSNVPKAYQILDECFSEKRIDF